MTDPVSASQLTSDATVYRYIEYHDIYQCIDLNTLHIISTTLWLLL